MADLHIEDFYRDVARVFVHLYASFPRKIVLYVEDICGPDQPDEFGLHDPRFDACFSTLIWLAQEDYLRFDETIGREALDQAVLTRRGFLLLASRSEMTPPEDSQALPPSVTEELQTNIAQLRSALKSASSIRIKHCASYLLSQDIPAFG